MSRVAAVIGLIAVVVILSLVVAVYPAVFGSVDNDARANNITNSSHNISYQQDVGISQASMGFYMALVVFIIVLIAIGAWLLLNY